MSIKSLASKGHDLLATAGSALQSPLLLAIRLYWGYGFYQTGTGKLHNFQRTLGFFTELGLPFPKLNVYAASMSEAGFGILLALGIFTRVASLPLIVIMGVAYATAQRDALMSIFSDPDKFVSADPFLFLLAAVTSLAFGPGAFSLDRLIFGKPKPAVKA